VCSLAGAELLMLNPAPLNTVYALGLIGAHSLWVRGK
jgi:hypothetical protein